MISIDVSKLQKSFDIGHKRTMGHDQITVETAFQMPQLDASYKQDRIGSAQKNRNESFRILKEQQLFRSYVREYERDSKTRQRVVPPHERIAYSSLAKLDTDDDHTISMHHPGGH